MGGLIGFSHVALTVTDVATSRRFYEDVLGMPVIDSSETYCALHPGSQGLTALILTQHEDGIRGPFSELRAGLDHVSLAVADRASLEVFTQRLADHGVAHDLRRSEWGHHLNFRDPDLIAVEILLLDPDDEVRSLLDG
jgi:catechol 2,3-dioxygenase-like lactoylglutathione lyase family enzyme